jgi:hypothetical protein
MDQVISSYEKAQAVLGNSVGFVGVVGGGVVTFLLLLAIRIIFRAFLLSWLGRKNGTFISGIVEFVVSVILVAFSYQNPGAVLTALGWNVYWFKQMVIAFKG